MVGGEGEGLGLGPSTTFLITCDGQQNKTSKRLIGKNKTQFQHIIV